MTYFNKFPLTYYELGSKKELVTDILRRSTFAETLRGVTGIYSEYDVQDGEKPEDVAYKFYSSATLHWVILLFNEIHSMYFQWPMTQQELVTYCQSVYGDNLYAVHHYERDGYIIGESKEYPKDGLNIIWIPPDNPGPQDPSVHPVSIFENEDRLNESRRKIKILNNDLVSTFITEFESSINV